MRHKRTANRRIAHGPAGLLAALLLGAAALPALAAGPEAAMPAVPPPALPPLVQPPSQERHPGKVIFAELVTPDLATARTFYGALFGWTFRDIEVGSAQYAAAMLDGAPVGGIFQRDIPAGEHRQSAWITFVSAPDVDATAALAQGHGAKLLFAPHDIPGLGREAVFADPQGAVFAALQSSSGDPPDILPGPGKWIWSSLITSDPDTDAAFYQTLFGYDVYDMPTRADAQHFILASGDIARASANPLPPRAGAHPAWIDFIRVDNAATTAAKVTALGGHVLVQPHIDRHGGQVAVVADPLGAPFGLLEWPDDASAGAAK